MPLGSILGAVGGAKGLFDLGIGGAALLKGGGGKKAHRRAKEMARLQAQLNKDAALQTAMLNNYAQTTPFASSQFVGTPGTADYRRVMQLDPAEQGPARPAAGPQGQHRRHDWRPGAAQPVPGACAAAHAAAESPAGAPQLGPSGLLGS